ncbi:MAG: T9SS type A sorting domain-containing protein [Chitinophagales bacterium]|nr:T9SS type A sorting domain-containing protein [Sphingobacteriales bacterium]MBK6890032.1 T9SS type A sorting domain-containing protein [Sphingobacteriales bacterium]MBK8678208.1 T9SS type A sorting domain-containing protein [Sphingobacteriales bacterium]MBL0248907.1 T9SS type A sorting domain-containing protein [Sphingobacteriales bacterium]MCC7057894.1 T9SS type A sorting domain-containing protein [Chitinophagales bacterium]
MCLLLIGMGGTTFNLYAQCGYLVAVNNSGDYITVANHDLSTNNFDDQLVNSSNATAYIADFGGNYDDDRVYFWNEELSELQYINIDDQTGEPISTPISTTCTTSTDCGFMLCTNSDVYDVQGMAYNPNDSLLYIIGYPYFQIHAVSPVTGCIIHSIKLNLFGITQNITDGDLAFNAAGDLYWVTAASIYDCELYNNGGFFQVDTTNGSLTLLTETTFLATGLQFIDSRVVVSTANYECPDYADGFIHTFDLDVNDWIKPTVLVEQNIGDLGGMINVCCTNLYGTADNTVNICEGDLATLSPNPPIPTYQEITYLLGILVGENFVLDWSEGDDPTIPIAYQTGGCAVTQYVYRPRVRCTNELGENYDLNLGDITVNVYPDLEVQEPNNCSTRIKSQCPNAIVKYDKNLDGFYESIFPPKAIPDSTITYGYKIYLPGGQIQLCSEETGIATATCNCDEVQINYIPDTQGGDPGNPFTLNKGFIDVIGGAEPYKFQWNNTGFVKWTFFGSDGSTNGKPEFSIIYSKTATWSVTITDAVGCEVVISNQDIDGGITIFDIESYNIYDDNCTTKKIFEGGVVVTLNDGGTAPYTFNWTGPGTWTDGPLSVSTLSNTHGISKVPSGWYYVYITDSSIPTKSTEEWYYVKCLTGDRQKTSFEQGNAFELYNDPGNQQLLVAFSAPNEVQANITLFNANGNTVAQLYNGLLTPESQTITWQTNNLPKGLYLAEMRTANGDRFVKKFVLQ